MSNNVNITTVATVRSHKNRMNNKQSCDIFIINALNSSINYRYALSYSIHDYVTQQNWKLEVLKTNKHGVERL